MYLEKTEIEIVSNWQIAGKTKKDKATKHSEIVGKTEIDFGHDLESLDLLFEALNKIYTHDHVEYNLKTKSDNA